MRRFRSPRRLRTTASGRWLLGIALAVGFAAINTSNNLLFLAWSLILGAIVISGLVSEAMLRPLRLQVVADAVGSAGTVMRVQVRLHNAAHLVPTYGVQLRLHLRRRGDWGRDKHSHSAARRARSRPAALLRLLPGRSTMLSVLVDCPARGVYDYVEARIDTLLPFGVFRKTRIVRLLSGHAVYAGPQVVPPLQASPPLAAAEAFSSVRDRRLQGEFFALTPYRLGDDPRRIHWRRSASAGATGSGRQRFTAQAGRVSLLRTEDELQATRAVLLRFSSTDGPVERVYARLAGAVLALIEGGYRVAVYGPGLWLTAEQCADHDGRRRILAAASAVLDNESPPLPSGFFAWPVLALSDCIFPLAPPATKAAAARKSGGVPLRPAPGPGGAVSR